VIAATWRPCNDALARIAGRGGGRAVDPDDEHGGGAADVEVRRGLTREAREIGCSIIQSKSLPEGLTEPVFWHIDRFDSPDRARADVAPASIAFDAAGTWWLMTIERPRIIMVANM
jgi:hypothetical protein